MTNDYREQRQPPAVKDLAGPGQAPASGKTIRQLSDEVTRLRAMVHQLEADDARRLDNAESVVGTVIAEANRLTADLTAARAEVARLEDLARQLAGELASMGTLIGPLEALHQTLHRNAAIVCLETEGLTDVQVFHKYFEWNRKAWDKIRGTEIERLRGALSAELRLKTDAERQLAAIRDDLRARINLFDDDGDDDTDDEMSIADMVGVLASRSSRDGEMFLVKKVIEVERERDAYLGLIVYPTNDPWAPGVHWGPIPDELGCSTQKYRSRDLAVRAARAAAGLADIRKDDRARYRELLSEALTAFCGVSPPDELVIRWVEGEDGAASGGLQDWAASYAPVSWATGIGTIEAAEALAREPREV